MHEMKTINLGGVVYGVRDPTKAPEGYGLGTTGQMTNDWNNEVKSGFFYGKNNSPDGGWWAGAVYANATGYAFQHLFKSNAPSLQKVRELVNGTWGDWIDGGPAAFAPAGYGLGGYAKGVDSTADINNIMAFGVYEWGSSAPTNAPGTYMCMIPVFRNSTNGTQYFQKHTLSGAYETVGKRVMADGKWGEFEWINPPMTLGVEYRTTERWNGKAVYTKAIYMGALLNNGALSVSANAKVTAVIDIRGYIYNSVDKTYAPIFTGSNNALATYVWVTADEQGTAIWVKTLMDMPNREAYAIIKYTKD